MTIEQRLRRVEEKVSQKKRVSEDTDDLYVIRMKVSRKLKEISFLMNQTAFLIDRELRDARQFDRVLGNISDNLKTMSKEYADLI